MTQKEIVQILAIIKAAYPNSYKMTEEEASGTIGVWYMQFSNISANVVLMAVSKHISTSKFPPSIYEIKNKISSIHWEAYEMVSDINFDSLPQATKEEYRRIYEETKPFKYEKSIEPRLQDMLCGDNRLLIE